MTTGSLLALSVLFLGTGVYEHDGLFSVFALAWLTLGFVALVVAACGYLGILRIRVAPPSEGVLAAGLLFFLYIATLRLPGAYVDARSIYAHTYYLSYMALIALVSCVFLFAPRVSPLFKYGILLAAVVDAFLLRIGMLQAVPSPSIDVFTAAQHAADVFLQGRSPYTPDGSIVTFHYPPLNLYLQSLSFGLIGDVRGLYILSEAIFCGFLWWIAARAMGSVRALLLVCLFLFHPRGLYVLGLAWTEPPILAFLAAALFFAARGKSKTAAVLYGLMLSLKQYLIFFLVHWFLVDRSWRRFTLLLGAGALTLVPFLILDPMHLWDTGFVRTLEQGFRTDSLTFVTLLYKAVGVTLPRMTSFLVGAIASMVTFLAFRRYPEIPGLLFSAAITTFAVFLFGFQAFANYYYLVSGIVILVLAFHTEGTEEA